MDEVLLRKPQSSIMEYLILNSSKKGGTILDIFAGSGTTGVVAKRNERSAILIEKEKEFVDVIHKRLAIG